MSSRKFSIAGLLVVLHVRTGMMRVVSRNITCKARVNQAPLSKIFGDVIFLCGEGEGEAVRETDHSIRVSCHIMGPIFTFDDVCEQHSTKDVTSGGTNAISKS